MPVYEIKNPSPLPSEPKKTTRRVDPAEGVKQIVQVRQFRQDRPRPDMAAGYLPGFKGGKDREEEIFRLLDQFNASLAAHGIDVHAALFKEDNAYILDIYDCTDNHVCKIVKEKEIHLEDIPQLIARLQEEAGLLIDTVS